MKTTEDKGRRQIKTYKLLTLGPLTTTDSVKQEMLFDHCTRDKDYKQVTQRIRGELLQLVYVDEAARITVLIQGSGTFGIESVISSMIPNDDCLLLPSDDIYGERIAAMCYYHHISCVHITQDYDKIPDRMKVEETLRQHPEVTYIAMTHSETTAGVLNNIQSISKLARTCHEVFVVDTTSSFAGMNTPMHDWHIDSLVSSINRRIQGVPDFSFIIAKKELLIASRSCVRGLSSDLYDQWVSMGKDGRWCYIPPVHVVLAFAKAMEELQKEGGVPTRSKCYAHNRDILIEELSKLNLLLYVEKAVQGLIITTFLCPDADSDFTQIYRFIKRQGYVTYLGELTDRGTFRVGAIGEIYEEDILRLAQIIRECMENKGN